MINKIKNNKKNLILIGSYILFIIIISILNYFFLSINISKYLVIIATIILFCFFSYKEGKKRLNKGYLGGLKISLIEISILVILNLIFIHNPFNIKRFIYYLIITLINILNSIIGINKKAN